MSELERRYRRLLAWYPRDHREQHGEEMLAVLLSAAGDRTRPGWRDTADLVWGALRLHLRRLAATDVARALGDVLAIVSLLGPVAILAGATGSLHELAWWVKARSVPPYEQIPDAPVWFVWLAVAVLVVLGKHRAAAVGAWVGAVGLVLLVTVPYMQWRWNTAEAGWVLLGVITAIALTLSPGPARGRELTGRAPIAITVATVGVFVALGVLVYRSPVADWAALGVFVTGVAAACGVRTRTGRAAALVLVVPVMTVLIAVLVWSVDGLRLNAPAAALVYFGGPVVLLLALGALPRLLRRRPGEPVT